MARMTVRAESVAGMSRGLPGPRPDPVFGSLGNAVRFGRDPIGYAGKLFARFGPLVSISEGDLGRKPPLARWVLVEGSDLYREVAARTDVFHKPPLTKQLYPRGENVGARREALRRWGAGLFNLNGEAHREHREVMMPAFHRTRIEGYCAEMAAITEEELATWVPGSVRPIRDDMMFLTLRIVARCLLGESVTERGDGSICALIQRGLRQLVDPGVFLFPFDLPGLPYRRFLDVVERSDKAVRKTIAEKRARGATEDDMLSMLIQARFDDGSPLNENQIVEHTGVMFIAGQETSANALVWTLLLLSQHPRIAADVLDELEGLLRGSPPSPQQLGSLPLLDGVIRESLRLMSPVPMSARVVMERTELRGHVLPKDTQLLVSLFHTHRAPQVFPHPNAFDPYRWETCKPGPYEYVPFGAGVRTCIGAPFATAELKITLAMLLQRFRFELLPGTRVDRASSVTTTVKGSLPMRIHRQDRNFTRGAGQVRGNFLDMVELPA